MDKKAEIEILFKKMMIDFEETSQNDEIYRTDIEDTGVLKVQWDLCGIFGYQILELDNYSYEFGTKLDDPDFTFVMTDPDLTIKFLRGESFDEFAHVRRNNYKGKYVFKYTKGQHAAKETNTVGMFGRKIRKRLLTVFFDKEKNYHPFIIGKFPMFRKIRGNMESYTKKEENYGSYIPINQFLGTFEEQVLPLKVFKHFFDNASHIVVINSCMCRDVNECKDHKHEIGCMYLGDESLNIIAREQRGRIITKEEALQIVKDAVEDGLIPLLGRSYGEAKGNGIEDSGHEHFMSMCFCCSCCCVNGKMMTYGSSGIKLYYRMEGLTVTVDEDLCVGCGDCLEVCVFKGMSWVDDKAVVNQTRCLGCGRCAKACQNDAISIIIDDNSRVNELIETLESYVDVQDQGTLEE